MRKRIIGLAVAILLVGAILAARWRRVHSLGSAPSGGGGEAAGVDHGLSPFQAAFDAPEGPTPCDTAYNAYSALDAAARTIGKEPPWASFPDKAKFLARCNALTPQEQLCYGPRYGAKNHPVCDPILQKYAQNNPLWGS